MNSIKVAIISAITVLVISVASGCLSNSNKPIPVYDEVTFTVILKDDIPRNIGGGRKLHGQAICTNTTPQFCTLEISKEDYPDCLYHELRHAFEGNWHEGYETTWDCDK